MDALGERRASVEELSREDYDFNRFMRLATMNPLMVKCRPSSRKASASIRSKMAADTIEPYLTA